MDAQMDQFLDGYVNKALNGTGFAIYSPQEKEQFKEKLLNYFSDLIFDTLVRSLNDSQIAELNALPDLSTPEAQQKISTMTAAVPGFIFILQERFEKEATEIGQTGKIPQPPAEAPAMA